MKKTHISLSSCRFCSRSRSAASFFRDEMNFLMDEMRQKNPKNANTPTISQVQMRSAFPIVSYGYHTDRQAPSHDAPKKSSGVLHCRFLRSPI